MKTVIAAVIAVACVQSAMAADLSPAKWDQDARQRAETSEAQTWMPSSARTVRGSAGTISATVSAISVQAGVETLRRGGNAADAAASVALTQVATQLGAPVSYAGIMTLVYYDAKTGKVFSLDAGYNTYRGETDPKTIPASDLSFITGVAARPNTGSQGRKTLVPGFMAGLEAMHTRFGRLPFGSLFAPAIWYAENGVTVSPTLGEYFRLRESALVRTPEGERFVHPAGGARPKAGDLYRQPELAATLRAVARHGAQYMYTGAWAKAFVATVQREGGKATMEDLAAYRPTWSEPAHARAFGHDVYVGGAPNIAAYQILTGLDVAAAMNIDRRGPYWTDVDVFRDMTRISAVVAGAPNLDPRMAEPLRAQGIDVSPVGQRTPAYARAVAALLPVLYGKNPGSDTHHSNAIVVVDREGNVAAMTHTINAVIWGDTGIVVDGVPIPDSAGFQQAALAAIPPGTRLPNEIPDVIVLGDNGKPVLATASIGSSLVPETLRMIVSTIGQHQDFAAVAAAPPLLISTDPSSYALPHAQRPVSVPAGAYEPAFLGRIRAAGMSVAEIPAGTVPTARGTLAAVAIDPDTGLRTAQEIAGASVFAGTE